MADFQQRMKDWQRICDSMQGGIMKCDNCPLFKALCQHKPNEKVDFAKAEQIIEKWVEEHPEPVYPTWEEWLITQGIIKENPNGVGWPMPKLFERIPADIAQKLGIEPKEAQHG